MFSLLRRIDYLSVEYMVKRVEELPVMRKYLLCVRFKGKLKELCFCYSWHLLLKSPFQNTIYKEVHVILVSKLPLIGFYGIHNQLTTKSVDNDHSRNRAPHFLCGSLIEDESTLTINTPVTHTPVPFKKPLNKCGTPIALRDILSRSNQLNHEADNMEEPSASNNQTLGNPSQFCC